MTRANADIHEAFMRSNVKKWAVAERLGMVDAAFSRKLRRELPQEEKKRIKAVIEALREES